MESGNCLFQIEAHVLLQQMFMHERGHGIVDGSHYLIGHLDNAHLGSSLNQIFGHFQSDETTTNNEGTLHGVLRQIGLDAVGVVDIAQRKNAFAVDAGQRRLDGRCSGRKEQFVVGFGVAGTISFTHFNGFGLAVDAYHFLRGTNVHIQSA